MRGLGSCTGPGPGVGRPAVGTRRGQEPAEGGRLSSGPPKTRRPCCCVPASSLQRQGGRGRGSGARASPWRSGEATWGNLDGRTRAAAGAPGPPTSLQSSWWEGRNLRRIAAGLQPRAAAWPTQGAPRGSGDRRRHCGRHPSSGASLPLCPQLGGQPAPLTDWGGPARPSARDWGGAVCRLRRLRRG